MLTLFSVAIPVIYIHLGTLLFVVMVILFADKQALSWMRGKREVLSMRTTKVLHMLVWIGLVSMIVSGIFLAWPMREFLVQDIAFWIKMGFVGVLVVNGFFIGSAMGIAHTQSFASLSKGEKYRLFVSGGASTVGWIGAAIAALYMSSSGWVVYLFSQVMNLF